MKFEVSVNVHLVDEFDRRLAKAQYALDSQVMTDMLPFMPMVTGNFIHRTQIESQSIAGTGEVCGGAAPFGRFLYYGKVMIDPATGSPWARRGAKKVVTDRPLRFSSPAARPLWFEEAKATKAEHWKEIVKKSMEGKNGKQ